MASSDTIAQYNIPPLDDQVWFILGRPCFACGHIAERLRQLGYVIERKAEPEQAAVIHFMLTHYAQHGPDKWMDEADATLKRKDDNGTRQPT